MARKRLSSYGPAARDASAEGRDVLAAPAAAGSSARVVTAAVRAMTVDAGRCMAASRDRGPEGEPDRSREGAVKPFTASNEVPALA